MLTPLAFSRPRHQLTPSRDTRIPAEHRQYYLEVRSRIAVKNRDQFVKQGIALLDAFKANGLTLVASAWSTSSDPITVINYWDMGNDANSLLEAELALPDIPQFNAFNDLIDDEIKSITIPIAAAERVDLPMRPPNTKLPGDYRYLRASMEVDSANLPEFAARIDGYMVKLTSDAGWTLGDTYYSITGSAGRISQLWVIQDTDPREVAAKLRRAPWLAKDLVGNTLTFDIFGATPSDPNLDPGRAPR
jgi:hypothetical protein